MVEARLSDGTTIEVAIAGSGPSILLAVDPHPAQGSRADELRRWGVNPELGREIIDGLSDRFRVIAFDYEGHLAAHPQPDSLTPGIIASDLLAVADASGADRFAYYGYSWLAVAGLQLALRTDRLTALAMGGYPPIDGPYDEMLRVTAAAHDLARAAEEATTTTTGTDPTTDPTTNPPDSAASVESPAWDGTTAWAEDGAGGADYDWSNVEMALSEPQTRQYRTLYRDLQGFDDRAIQEGLTMPRLCFAGSHDAIDYGEKWGDVHVDIVGPLIRKREELEKLGWRVQVLDGLDHTAAMQPNAVLPVLRPWLTAALL